MKRTAFLLILASLRTFGQSFLGGYTAVEPHGTSTTIHAREGSIRLTFYSADVLRVDYLPHERAESDSSFAVIRDARDGITPRLSDRDSAVALSSGALGVVCRKSPLRLAFERADGRELLRESDDGGFGFDGAARLARFTIDSSEHFYGGGEQGTAIDKRDQAFDCYNTQVGGYSTPRSTMNIGVPFLISSKGYALFFDNPYRCHFDIGFSQRSTLSYTASGGELTVYFIAAPSMEKALERYTWLTGRQPLPPRWAFGFIQSKNRYRNSEEARTVVRELRERNIPCDAIVLDLAWFKNMGDLCWDSTAWPNPGAMLDEFRSLGIKTILITEPYIVRPSVNFAAAEKGRFLATDSEGKPYALSKWWSCGGCDAFLLDITNSEARRWWWDKYTAFMGNSVAGLWTDLGEPERHPSDMRHALGSASRVHNLYNVLWAQTIYDGMATFRPGERLFNLTRSGWAGIQRYGVIPWSGDVARSFGGLAVQPPMLLGMGMSALAYHNSDIGGYSRVPTSSELYIRWMQYGTFCPIARAHGAGENTGGSPTEPWMFGPQAEEICRSYITLRYRLLPYIYTLAHDNYESGIPLARPLVMMYPGDSALTSESSTYLWGDELLVSPVVEAGQRIKKVNLPPGIWINYWTDEQLAGGRSVSVSSPLEEMPLFVRSGSIVPMGEPVRYSDERPLDTLTLCIWPRPEGRSEYTLYEDDGKTTEYQKGRFALTSFSVSSVHRGTKTDLAVRIGRAKGEFSGKLSRRTVVAEIHLMAARPDEVTLNSRSLRESSPLPSQKKARSFSYDRKRKEVWVRFSSSTDSVNTLLLKNVRLSGVDPSP
ncbi:MAG TPA: glycoside hydrolase family 31 protein [Bacteroidota bacterium]|nr:glycoside hydrolase family 31 protein [Bacteroidota bacterium]